MDFWVALMVENLAYLARAKYSAIWAVFQEISGDFENDVAGNHCTCEGVLGGCVVRCAHPDSGAIGATHCKYLVSKQLGEVRALRHLRPLRALRFLRVLRSKLIDNFRLYIG